MLPPHSRLRRSADIGLVRQQGQRWRHPLLILFVYTQPPDTKSVSRFAVAVGRHIGQATRRNRIKRRVREIVRLQLGRLGPGYDCLIVVRAGAVQANYSELEAALHQLLIRSGVMNGDSNVAEGVESLL
ncbi:MAG: ribonuclease P protein component [Candidatus Promineofilum sp.]|nr:ribonuclease P protein component [Promineifilum sp.]